VTSRTATARNAAFVVLAGGRGTRIGSETNKVYLPLAGRRVISWSFVWASRVAGIEHFILVTRPEDVGLARGILAAEAGGLDVEVVLGGTTRHRSEQAALDHLRPRIESGALDVVAIHDGARPLARPGLVEEVIRTASTVGGALPCLPATGLMPVDPARTASSAAQGGEAAAAERLVRVQTPQAFRAAGLLLAYDAAARAGFDGTDTASCVEAFSDITVRAVRGSRRNLKVTYPHDLALAERWLSEDLRR
jgi:2-C-methyl-D-erythritol 4-phosphate cytidylyltransferase